MDNAFPAGEESECSSDEWDIGTTCEKTPCVQVTSDVLHFIQLALASLRVGGLAVDSPLFEDIFV